METYHGVPVPDSCRPRKPPGRPWKHRLLSRIQTGEPRGAAGLADFSRAAPVA